MKNYYHTSTKSDSKAWGFGRVGLNSTFKQLFLIGLFFMLVGSFNQALADTHITIKDGEWHEAGTWNLGVPADGDNVEVTYKIIVAANASCVNALILDGGRVSVMSGIILDITGQLSFGTTRAGILELFTSTESGSASVIFKTLAAWDKSIIYVGRDVSGSSNTNSKIWHTITAPMLGLSFENFISGTFEGNKDFIWTNATKYAIGRYVESTNSWEYPVTTAPFSISGYFNPGQGYTVARNANGSLKMGGYLVDDNLSVSITRGTAGTPPIGGYGWNALGNPFTASINVKEFLDANAGKLDATHGGLYVWDPGTLRYLVSTYATDKVILNLGSGLTTYTPVTGEPDVQVGQGFIVRAAENGSVSFNYGMRHHNPSAAFKTGTSPWPAVGLKVEANGTMRSTLIAFNAEMTSGLDSNYDAGLLRGGTGLEIYTKLVEGNSTEMAMQCLPDAGYDYMVIPVSLDYAIGGEVTISAKSANLPFGYEPVLEDRLLGKRTSLKEGSSYKVTLPANTAGINRFYLHFAGTSGIPDETISALKVYSAGKEIHIKGMVAGESIANLYDLAGKSVGSYKLQAADNNIVSAEGVLGGIYLLRIMDGTKQVFSGKINIQ
jgi:hypothetical protein